MEVMGTTGVRCHAATPQDTCTCLTSATIPLAAAIVKGVQSSEEDPLEMDTVFQPLRWRKSIDAFDCHLQEVDEGYGGYPEHAPAFAVKGNFQRRSLDSQLFAHALRLKLLVNDKCVKHSLGMMLAGQGEAESPACARGKWRRRLRP
eukprot:CAMPEP_0185163796 /NCGR_PEP_ID=MMETSP1139-20130426/8512_1 /TAXON_ID=298111 /ORGANISM="Pavlova sp., Strain CCMP459" /LENGTH=146 /DNA_ID=CAMNT_0027729161 /DNA_START=72 /DNA_END=510 /DNA_ORIENTATION=+